MTNHHVLTGFFPPLPSLPREMLAGLVVALGVVPEAIAFSQLEVLNLNTESLDLFGRFSDAPHLVEGARCELAR